MAHLENQVVMITGCSSGIGMALVQTFVESGHRVIATARKLASIEGLAQEGVHLLELDVTNADSISKVVAAAMEWAGRIDIVVNNAGFALIGPVAEIDLDDLRKQLETNVVGVVALVKAVAPQMVERRSGRIVNIGSVSGVTATPFAGAYCASKAAVHLISDAMRMELAPFGVRVITVQPGAVESRFGESAGNGLDRYRDGSMYSRVFKTIKARAGASQVGAMPVKDFTRWLADKVTAPAPPMVIRAGPHSVRLPLIGRLPPAIRDRIFSRRFGLDRLQ